MIERWAGRLRSVLINLTNTPLSLLSKLSIVCSHLIYLNNTLFRLLAIIIDLWGKILYLSVYLINHGVKIIKLSEIPLSMILTLINSPEVNVYMYNTQISKWHYFAAAKISMQ